MAESSLELQTQEFQILLESLGIEGESRKALLNLTPKQKQEMINVQKKSIKTSGLDISKQLKSILQPFSTAYSIVDIDRCNNELSILRFKFITLTEQEIEVTMENNILEDLWGIISMLCPAISWPDSSRMFMQVEKTKQNKPIYKILEPVVKFFKSTLKSPAVIRRLQKSKKLFREIFLHYPSDYVMISTVILEIAIKCLGAHADVVNEHMLEHNVKKKESKEHLVCAPLCSLRLNIVLSEIQYNLMFNTVTEEYAEAFLNLLAKIYNETTLLNSIKWDSLLRICDISKVLTSIEEAYPKRRKLVGMIIESQEKARRLASEIDVRKIEIETEETRRDLDSIVNVLSVLNRIQSSRIYDVLQYIKGCVLEESAYKNKEIKKIEQERAIRQKKTEREENKCICKNILPKYRIGEIGLAAPSPEDKDILSVQLDGIKIADRYGKPSSKKKEKEEKKDLARQIEQGLNIQQEKKAKAQDEIVEDKRKKNAILLPKSAPSVPFPPAPPMSVHMKAMRPGIVPGTMSGPPPGIGKLNNSPIKISAAAFPPPNTKIKMPMQPRSHSVQAPPCAPPKSIDLAPPPLRGLDMGKSRPGRSVPIVPDTNRPPSAPICSMRSGKDRIELAPIETNSLAKLGPRAQYIENTVLLQPSNPQQIPCEVHIRKPAADGLWSQLDKADLKIFRKDDFKVFNRKKIEKQVEEESTKVIEGVFDKKKCKAIDIMLARVKISHEKLIKAVDDLDEKPFTETLLFGLINSYPSEEELEMVQKHNVQLVPEIFYKKALKVSGFKDKLVILHLKLTLPSIKDFLLPSVRKIIQVSEIVLNAKKIHTILRMTLAIINVLNSSGRNQGAWGIKLESLPRILENANIVALLQKKIKEQEIHLEEEIKVMKEAVKISIDIIETDCQENQLKKQFIDSLDLTPLQKKSVEEIIAVLNVLKDVYTQWRRRVGELGQFLGERDFTGQSLQVLLRYIIGICTECAFHTTEKS